MKQKLATGIDGFEEIRKKQYFFVDKTYFIKEWWEQGDKVTLITRPRRFGKTMNMNMLECFFSTKYAGRDDLFEGLAVWEDEKYRELQGTYPVINLSFADVKCADYIGACKVICQNITKVFKVYSDIIDNDKLGDKDKVFLEQVNIDMPDYIAIQSLQELSAVLQAFYGEKVIILLDEYDTPLIEAYTHGYWQEMTEFMRGLFNATFKSNPSLYRGVMTGVTRISKESMFSDLNNLRVVTTTSSLYSTSFGFTEDEVFAALDTYGYGDQKEEVKRWYDGFTFGKVKDIYNPWSIINFLFEGEYDSYWVNTSSNALLNQLVRTGSADVKEKVEDLIQGKSIFVSIDEEIIYNQLDDQKDAIWSLMLASGYLKVVELHRKKDIRGNFKKIYELAITNEEVYIMFEKFIDGWFRGDRNEVYYNEFVRNLLQNNVKKMNTFMNKVALETISYFDTGMRPSESIEPERFYHGFVLGLLVELKEKYEVLSNRESGYGRYDVMLVPNNLADNAYVLEFKVFDPDEEKTLEDTVASALAQIEEKEYTASLIARGIEKEKIFTYGFAFEGKTVLIG